MKICQLELVGFRGIRAGKVIVTKDPLMQLLGDPAPPFLKKKKLSQP
jgi:hypothetical protein